MKILLRHVEPLGFKGSNHMPASWNAVYHQFFPGAGVLVGISNLIPAGVWKVVLTPKQTRAYLNDQVCVTPPHCCAPCAGGRAVVSFESQGSWLHQGEVKSFKQLRKILSHTGLAAFRT